MLALLVSLIVHVEDVGVHHRARRASVRPSGKAVGDEPPKGYESEDVLRSPLIPIFQPTRQAEIPHPVFCL